LAPGGRLVVSGWAAPSERVTLRSPSGARAWAGSRGGFKIKAHVELGQRGVLGHGFRLARIVQYHPGLL